MPLIHFTVNHSMPTASRLPFIAISCTTFNPEYLTAAVTRLYRLHNLTNPQKSIRLLNPNFDSIIEKYQKLTDEKISHMARCGGFAGGL